jgi:hypothetical protein
MENISKELILEIIERLFLDPTEHTDGECLDAVLLLLGDNGWGDAIDRAKRAMDSALGYRGSREWYKS